MILLEVVKGQIYGEMKAFQMPSEKGKNVIQVLDTEGIWIEPSCGLNEQGRSAWRDSLTRWLAFNPSNRPKGKCINTILI